MCLVPGAGSVLPECIQGSLVRRRREGRGQLPGVLVSRPTPAQMAGLQVGRKIYSVNEDLVFLRPFAEVESILSQSFCSRRPLRLLVATKAKE